MPANPVLRLSSSNQSINNLDGGQVESTKNYYTQQRLRLVKEFPTKYCIFHSIFLLLFCSAMIVAERMQPDNFTYMDFYIISYRTLDGLILISCLVNVFYAVLSLFTGKIYKNLIDPLSSTYSYTYSTKNSSPLLGLIFKI
jgi:hypothetical protein